MPKERRCSIGKLILIKTSLLYTQKSTTQERTYICQNLNTFKQNKAPLTQIFTIIKKKKQLIFAVY